MNVNKFIEFVQYYLHNEYNCKYSLEPNVIEVIKSYYWGGNNVPDTARAAVEYINSFRCKS